MLASLFATLRGSVTLTLMFFNTVFWFIPIILMGLLKLVTPWQPMRSWLTRWMTYCGEFWVMCNQGIFRLILPVRWDISGTADLRREDWYLIVANHRSWIDILTLQQAFNRRIPFLKFFIKQSLIWVPFLGQAWWAMDMPFMKRHSRAAIAKRPELRGQDLATTRKACEHFRHVPTSIFNFVEGTRYTDAKHAATESPYQHLLLPRAGGIGFTLGSMGDILRRLIDVTIVYPRGSGSLWDFCCGRVRHIVVEYRERPLPQWLTQGDYHNDPQYRERFQAWLRDLWSEKDQQIGQLLARYPGPNPD
ncbi:MAG: acyltransferase [Wenzhouxiangellaceae bacterium]